MEKRTENMCLNDNEFYPTPDALADRMADLIQKRAKIFLEPSAGTGNLIKAIFRKKGQLPRYSSVSVDYCEIDQDRRGAVNEYFREKSFEVHCVCDDFEHFHSEKKYDVIIMNPPFSNAVEHILRAIEIQERWGGQVIALCNADTIRNLYSNKRKVLKQKLDNYEANIEYIQNAFSDAMMRTDVEVALINLMIPEKVEDTGFIKNLKKSFYTQREQEATQVIQSGAGKIDGMIQQFEFEVRIGTEIGNLYSESLPYLTSEKKGFTKPTIELNCDDHPFEINTYIEKTRQKYWSIFFKNDAFIENLTSTLRDEFIENVNVMKDYDFNHFNVEQMLKEISGRMEKAYHDTLLSLFDKLSCVHSFAGEPEETNIHFYNGWKTNKAWKINDKRVILPFYQAFQKSTIIDLMKLAKTLSDIEKTIQYLDGGQTANLAKDWLAELSTLQKNNKSGKNIECKYFFIDIYKKGTCHIKWKDSRVVDKLNIYGSMRRGWLPPSYGKKDYKEMGEEEKAVIDAFQGKKAYSEMMANPMLLNFNMQNVGMLAAGTEI